MTRLLVRPHCEIFEKQTDPNDPRLKNIVFPYNPRIARKHIDVGIIGIPFDLGVKFSNGRVGSALAPDKIRKQMKRYGTAYDIDHGANLENITIVDFGNVAVTPSGVEPTHNITTLALAWLLKKCNCVIVLGGGNDLTFATVHALSQYTGSEIGGMNVDAHLDVREVCDGIINSGTPYRRLIEHKVIKGENLFEVGIQGHVNSKKYWGWAKEQGVRIFTLNQLRQIEVWRVMNLFRTYIGDKNIPSAFVSIDIDSVAQAFAPGSSAPSPDGLFPKDILEIAHTAGTISQVKLFEIMEVNPLYDQDNRTSRLAVNIILEFLAGYTQRKTP